MNSPTWIGCWSPQVPSLGSLDRHRNGISASTNRQSKQYLYGPTMFLWYQIRSYNSWVAYSPFWTPSFFFPVMAPPTLVIMWQPSHVCTTSGWGWVQLHLRAVKWRWYAIRKSAMAVSYVEVVLRLPYVFLLLMSVWLSALVQESSAQGELPSATRAVMPWICKLDHRY